jgi:O-antigen/teichoic acid export membrane protein
MKRLSGSRSSPRSLAQLSVRGAAWNYGGAAVVIVGQLLYTALTARLISPSEFGAYATAQALLMLVGYLTLATLGNAVIRQPVLERGLVGTALLMSGATGIAVSLVVLAVAGPWAQLWRSPGAESLLRLFAPQVLLVTLAVVPMALIRRDLRFRAATLIETASTVLGFGVGALLAVRLRNADALALGQIANAGALCTLSVLSSRTQLQLAFSRSSARSLFSFSSQVSLQNLGHYVNNTLPSFAVSRSLGQASLGYFSRGSLLVGLPQTFLVQGISKTLYPIYPRFRNDEVESRRMMADVTSVTTTVIWPLFAALAGLAPLVVEILLGARWTPVASVIGPLCLYAMANIAYSIFAPFAEAYGYLRVIWWIQLWWSGALIAALGVAVLEDADMRAIVLVAAAVQIPVHMLQVALLARRRVVDVAATAKAEAWAAAIAAVWYLATLLTTELTVERGIVARIVSSGCVVVLLIAATYAALPRLPAGQALARRGVGVGWRPKLARTS